MPGPKVFVFAPGNEASLDEMREAGCELTLGTARWADPTGDTKDKFVENATHADALVGTSIKGVRIDRDVMMASENLRVIAKYTVGVDEIDVDDATELGILVTHAPTEANWGGVVESTVTMLLTILKKTRERDNYLKDGKGWRDDALTGTYLGSRRDGNIGITIGIVGMGRIGSRFSRFMLPWGVNLVGYDPYVADEHFASDLVRARLAALNVFPGQNLRPAGFMDAHGLCHGCSFFNLAGWNLPLYCGDVSSSASRSSGGGLKALMK